jgi:uncharacterized protein YbbC (DUF1343 family)
MKSLSSYLVIRVVGLMLAASFFSCARTAEASSEFTPSGEAPIIVGAERTDMYFPLLEGKRIAFGGNHTSLIGNTHVVDSLISSGFEVVKVFSPEHGFRGRAAAGEYVDSETDPNTGIPIVSLYGSNRRPTIEQLSGIDIFVFDIQDVGARFYTYISTMANIMREIAKAGIPMIILDRPNPNGHFVDGPMLDLRYGSFVGMHPVPVVHGMTIGEFAKMINEEFWLGHNIVVDLTVVTVENYNHSRHYHLPVAPSPNLPNMHSVYLYPSLCFFEGTVISLGRGTDKPFQVFGHSSFNSDEFEYTFKPQSISIAPDPPQKDKVCFGRDLSTIPLDSLQNMGRINLSFLIDAFRAYPQKDRFFNNFFDRLAGNSLLRSQILAGLSEEMIRESWQKDLDEFRKIREKYLLY